MAKKKAVVQDYLAGYVPATYSPGVTVGQIKQIPPYPDKGVAFAQYAKDQRGDDFLLVRQTPRFYSVAYTNQVSPTTDTITRSNKATAIFYCTGVLVQFKASLSSTSAYVDLYDGSSINPRFRVFYWGDSTAAANKMAHFFVDLSGCPRKFDQDIQVLINNGLTSGEWLHLELFGWEETR